MPYKVELPFVTILKILLAVLFAFAAIELAPLCMWLFMAVLLAVTLDPLVERFEKKGLPRWTGILTITLMLLGLLVFLALVVLPSLAEQVSNLAQKIPQMRNDMLSKLPENGILREAAEKFLQTSFKPEDVSKWMPELMSAGQVALNGFFQLFVILVFAIYMLIDGKSILKWFFAFFSSPTRVRLHATAQEVSEIMFAYVAGQLITSGLCALFSYIILMVLKVPAALMLALLAGVFDILPMLGFFLSLAPAVLLALTVSGQTAFLVLGLYLLYNAIENYLIIPKVYGDRLRLTTLTVLISLLVASTLAGVGGAIAVLPIVASYPIIERIWLIDWLGEKVIAKHEQQKNEEAEKPVKIQ